MTKPKPTTKLGILYRGKYTEAVKTHKTLVAEHKKGEDLIKQMPRELLDINWYDFRQLEPGKWYLETWGMPGAEGDDFIKELKMMGVHGIKSTYRAFANSWEYKGLFAVDGVEIVVKIDGGSKPPNCRIEETREMTEVITYKAICEETEEEV